MVVIWEYIINISIIITFLGVVNNPHRLCLIKLSTRSNTTNSYIEVWTKTIVCLINVHKNDQLNLILGRDYPGEDGWPITAVKKDQNVQGRRKQSKKICNSIQRLYCQHLACELIKSHCVLHCKKIKDLA